MSCYCSKPSILFSGFLLALAPTVAAQQSARDSAIMIEKAGGDIYKEFYSGADGSHERAAEAWTRAARLYRSLGELRAAAALLDRVGTLNLSLGRPDSAAAYYKEALDARGELGDPQPRAKTLNNLGVAHYEAARCDSAIVALVAADELAGDYRVRTNLAALFAQADSSRLGELRDAPDRRVPASCRADVLSTIGLGLAKADTRLEKDGARCVSVRGTARVVVRSVAPEQPPEDFAPLSEAALEAASRSWINATADRDMPTALATVGLAQHHLGNLYSALAYFGRALGMLRRFPNCDTEAATLDDMGRTYHELGFPREALLYHHRALLLRRRMHDAAGESSTLRLIGALYLEFGRPDSALHHLDAALAAARQGRSALAAAHALYQLGIVHHQLGRAEVALGYLHDALRLAPARDHLLRARLLSNLGVIQRERGAVDSAITSLTDALALRRQVGDRTGESVTLSNLARLAMQTGQADVAKTAFAKALIAVRPSAPVSAGDGPPPDRYQPLRLHREDLDSLASEAGLERGVTWVPRLMNAGDTAAQNAARRYQAQLRYYRELLMAPREVGDRLAEAIALNGLATIAAEEGQPDSALALLTSALTLMRAISNRAGEAEALHDIGGVYHRQLPVPRLATATAYYDSAAAVQTLIRQSSGRDEFRVSFAETGVRLFSDWSMAWLARAGELGTPALAGALAATERGRAQAVLDLIIARTIPNNAKASASTPTNRGDDLVAEGDSLIGIASLRDKNTPVLYYLQASDTLITWLITPRGELRVWRRPLSEDSLASLVSALRSSVGADSAPRVTSPQPRNQEPTRSGSARRMAHAAAYDLTLRQLSGFVLPPEAGALLAGGGELVIVPYGMLGVVPFAALSFAGDSVPLGIRYAIRYAPSLRALAAAEARRQPSATAPSLVVGNPAMPYVEISAGKTERLRNLPGAREEGRWVAGRLRTSFLTGTAASELQVRALLPFARLVHLATHGRAFGTEEGVRDSYVALAPSKRSDGLTSSAGDGLLTLGEIMDDDSISLSADLVVLSACETGLGDPKQAEGTVGLQRGLLAKGARTVLVSLWDVEDEATEFLMRSFYSHWLDDIDRPTKSESLRRAQNEVRNNGNHPHWKNPQYWAAFQLVGAG